MASFIKKWRTKAISMYGKARGLTKDQRAKVTAATHGKKTSRAPKAQKSKSSNPKSSKKKTGKVKKMAKKKRRRSRKMTIPLAPVIGLVPLVAPAIQNIIAGAPLIDVADALCWHGLGIRDVPAGTPSFDMGKCLTNFTPLIAGLLIHKFVGGAPLNLNRILARANVPFIRI